MVNYCIWSSANSLDLVVEFVQEKLKEKRKVERQKAYVKMNSRDYKAIITKISFNLLKKRFPGLEKKHIDEVAKQIGLNVHARMYGANVDGVDSPIWTSALGNDRMTDPRVKPNVDAKDLLNYEKAYDYSNAGC